MKRNPLHEAQDYNFLDFGQLLNFKAGNRTNICISWAPVGAKKFQWCYATFTLNGHTDAALISDEYIMLLVCTSLFSICLFPLLGDIVNQ